MKSIEEQVKWAEEIEARKKLRNAEQLQREAQARYGNRPKIIRWLYKKPKKGIP